MRPCERDSLFASQSSDDETLFAFYQLLRHKPKVIIVLRSLKEWTQGGPDYRTREAETACAMAVAGVEWEQWEFLDTDPEWWRVQAKIDLTIMERPDLVIAPAMEQGGHEQHNLVASAVWTACTLRGVPGIGYLTYKRGHGRSESPNEVVPSAEECILKDVALACYKSQAEFPPTAPWFGADQREFLA